MVLGGWWQVGSGWQAGELWVFVLSWCCSVELSWTRLYSIAPCLYSIVLNYIRLYFISTLVWNVDYHLWLVRLASQDTFIALSQIPFCARLTESSRYTPNNLGHSIQYWLIKPFWRDCFIQFNNNGKRCLCLVKTAAAFDWSKCPLKRLSMTPSSYALM